MRKNRAYLAAASVLLAALMLASCGENASPPEGFNGHFWMRLNRDQRFHFLWGYLGGLSDGQARICAGLKVPLKWKMDELKTCFDLELKYSKEPDFYTDEITTFYETYPQSKHTPVMVVLAYLSDKEAKSIEEIHILVKDRRFP